MTSVVSRWDTESGPALQPRFGAFLPTAIVTSFDCDAAGIKRGEAVTMDPQQRLLLEVRTIYTTHHQI